LQAKCQVCRLQRPARPERYIEVSQRIMDTLRDITPDVEIFSVDEAFLDLTHCQNLWGPPESMTRLIKQKVFEVSGIHCSLGLSGDKTTAKYAAKLHKPNGLTIISPWEARKASSTENISTSGVMSRNVSMIRCDTSM